jgi:hypothetical protein
MYVQINARSVAYIIGPAFSSDALGIVGLGLGRGRRFIGKHEGAAFERRDHFLAPALPAIDPIDPEVYEAFDMLRGNFGHLVDFRVKASLFAHGFVVTDTDAKQSDSFSAGKTGKKYQA